MNKHTPGPWTSDPDHIIGRIHALKIGMPIADCHAYVGFSQSLANAALISAAPELLACLQNWEFELVRRYGATHPGVLELRTAIAKATKSPD